jgi:tetratricopeptide (TPR) repeat protein
MYSHTEGNPFFIEELFRHLLEKGEITYPDGEFRSILNLAEIEVPENLRATIGRRLALLSNDTQRMLATAAVIGRSFGFQLLEASTQADSELLLDSVEEAERAGLISSVLEYPETRFNFTHALIRQVVVSGLSSPRRQRLHLRIANAIEQLYPIEERLDDLAHHLWNAGGSADGSRTLRYLQMAAESAVKRSANLEAINQYSKALELLKTESAIPDRAEKELALQIGLGVPLALTRGYSAPEVEATYNRARELSRRAGDSPHTFSLVLGLKRFFAFRGELQTALELGAQLLTLAEARTDCSLLARAHLMQGQTLYTLGELLHAQRHFEEGIRLYDTNKERPYTALYGIDSGAGCLSYTAIIEWFLGHADGALRPSQRALALARELAHPFNLAMTLTWAAFLHHLRQEEQTTLEHAEAVVSLATKNGFALWLAWGLVLQGWALVRKGSKEGIGQIEQGLGVWRSSGALLAVPQMLTLLADSYLRLHQTRDGLNTVSEALGSAERTGERLFEGELYRIKGDLLRQRRENARGEAPSTEEVEGCFLKALDIARRQHAKSLELRSLTSLARSLRQQPERKHQTEQLLAKSYGWFSEGLDTADLKEAKATLRDLQ